MTNRKKAKMTPKISIIILNWNNYEDTKECLESLGKITYPNYEVIVVDNGSTDGSYERLKEEFFHHIFIRNEENFGFAKGNNMGIKYALKKKVNYILLLNNDTVVDKNFLEPLVKEAEKNEKIGIVGGKIYYYNTPKRIWYAGGKISLIKGGCVHYGAGDIDRGQYNEPKEVGFVSGCMMLVKTEVFEKVGLLDERYFLGTEDYDFCLKVRRKGYKLFYVPNSIIFHKRGRSYEKFNPIHFYNGYLSKIIFMRQNFHPILWSSWYILFFLYGKIIKPWDLKQLAKRAGREIDVLGIKKAINAALKDGRLKNEIVRNDLLQLEQIISGEYKK
ncbi:glycosyltransferase family 2 protein [Candidatus Aminicenantes bacterium AC-335-O07]|nr:glycosyltransferase family 2 protein [Candidatus Aminicenantes bacterium AC-335-O07]